MRKLIIFWSSSRSPSHAIHTFWPKENLSIRSSKWRVQISWSRALWESLKEIAAQEDHLNSSSSSLQFQGKPQVSMNSAVSVALMTVITGLRGEADVLLLQYSLDTNEYKSSTEESNSKDFWISSHDVGSSIIPSPSSASRLFWQGALTFWRAMSQMIMLPVAATKCASRPLPDEVG